MPGPPKINVRAALIFVADLLEKSYGETGEDRFDRAWCGRSAAPPLLQLPPSLTVYLPCSASFHLPCTPCCPPYLSLCPALPPHLSSSHPPV